jgi:hypothetical protein
MSTCHDANQNMSIKVEDVSDTEQEEDHVQLRFSGLKTEHVVSCMSMSLLGRFHKYPEFPVASLISISVLTKPLNCGERSLLSCL